jgi:L-seryl-tRNA(Ser) seleniumtransferase
MTELNQQLLRKLPSVDTMLKDPAIADYAPKVPRNVVLNSIRRSIDNIRELITAGEISQTDENKIRQWIINDAKARIAAVTEPYYRKAINATGIILHTGLGRAVLPKRALDQIQGQLNGYSVLQVDVEDGKRSRRDEHIEMLLQLLTGAEAATVVNNNAAATAIVLNTIAKGKEVIVSRGQLVEIGGSFRLPDIMAFSGAKLVEVGTTNKTHPADYENAITENTTAILRVHPSNYKIEGFTAEVPTEELVEIAHRHGLIMIDDVGAGALMDFSRFGFEQEPTLIDSIRNGADIVTSSTDKLIGALQGGIILGKTKFINSVRKNQFARIVRPGKITLAVLEATLKLFLDENVAIHEVPTLQMALRSLPDITNRAELIVSRLKKKITGADVTTISGYSQMGSGSLPTQNLATMLVAILPQKIDAESLARQLRLNNPPIFTRIQNNMILIDPRTLLDGEDKIFMEALERILG